METKVYLAGGLNDFDWQNKVISSIKDENKPNKKEINDNKRFVFYNPREHMLTNSREYTIWDLFYVQKCDILFAYMQKENPSGFGLTLEVGYARALDKPIILVDEKSVDDENFKKYFKIVRESSSIVFNNLEDGIKFLNNLKNGIIVL